jgi:hypothetical protein
MRTHILFGVTAHERAASARIVPRVRRVAQFADIRSFVLPP